MNISSSSDDSLSTLTSTDESRTDKINSETPLTKNHSRRCSSVSSVQLSNPSTSKFQQKRRYGNNRSPRSPEIVFDIAL